MINSTLFKKELKSSMTLQLIIDAILLLYTWVVIYMYNPSLVDALQSMVELMPDLMKAFSMTSAFGSILEFLNQYLFGLLFLVIPAVFSIMLSVRLVAKYVDNGSMAYLLATPNSRKKIIFTQWLVLNLNILIMCVFIGASISILSNVYFPGELDQTVFTVLMIGLYLLQFSLANIFFCLSTIFNDTQKPIIISSLIVVVAYIARAISQFGNEAEIFKYFSYFTLFDATLIIKDYSSQYGCYAALFVVGLTCSIVAITYFERKDLSV